MVIYLFYKKLGFESGRYFRLITSIIIMTLTLSALTFLSTVAILRMALMLILCIIVTFWTFDYEKHGGWYMSVFWPSCYLVVVVVADNVTFSVANAMTDYPLEELMKIGDARAQFTLIYLLLVAAMIWLLVHIGEQDPDFPHPVGILLFVFMGLGIFAAESILDISLELGTNPATAGQAKSLSLFCYAIILMIFALLVTFETLGVILARNKRLKQQHQLALMEQQQYDLLVSATESLTQWKHDYQGQLRLLGALIEQERYQELKQFSDGLIDELPASACLLLSGNRTMDAVISLRMIDAKRQNITFECTLFIPERIPLNDVELASLIGNILDNAIEACRKLPPERADIHFEIKPWKQMMYIFCSNTSDGYYLSRSGSLVSTKVSEGHGIGIKRIKEIVSKAGGTCKFIPEDERFSVSIMIPLEECVK
jgi:Histidine kinase-, DNA gyrase B-, and HSP90-like ATPase.